MIFYNFFPIEFCVSENAWNEICAVDKKKGKFTIESRLKKFKRVRLSIGEIENVSEAHKIFFFSRNLNCAMTDNRSRIICQIFIFKRSMKKKLMRNCRWLLPGLNTKCLIKNNNKMYNIHCDSTTELIFFLNLNSIL